MLLKNVEISQDGPVRVGSGCGFVSGSASVSAASGGGAREARIVESNSEYAIIEVICSCGSKAFVQCNYADLGGGQ